MAAQVHLPSLLFVLIALGCHAIVGSAQPMQPPVTVSLALDHLQFTTLPTFKSWNIDASDNRQFFTRNLNNTELHYLARMSMPGLLRFGGTGNDFLIYGFGNTTCSPKQACLNQTWFVNLMDMARDAGVPVIFGLNLMRRTPAGDNGSTQWDPTNARELITFAIEHGYTFFGFELGNEQNNRFSPQEEAHDFHLLDLLLTELYPDPTQRPKILGPDCHGFHGVPVDTSLLQFLSEFAEAALELQVPLYAITHHEYIEVDNVTSFDPGLLDFTAAIAEAVTSTLSKVAPHILRFAGEIGPHNGGSPGCSHDSMRWATYADSVWYMDAMGAKAANGYAAFCRQNFIGIDYGLLDCATYAPLPDYYAGILWGSLMGPRVLNTSTDDASHNLRAYAHCMNEAVSPLVTNVQFRSGGATLLLINLLDSENTVQLPEPLAGVPRVEFRMSAGPQGNAGQQVALNGLVLDYTPMHLPQMPGQLVGPSSTVTLAGQSWAFLTFPSAGLTLCQ